MSLNNKPINLCSKCNGTGNGSLMKYLDIPFISFYNACVFCDGTGYDLINVKIRPWKGSKYWRTYIGKIDFKLELFKYHNSLLERTLK